MLFRSLPMDYLFRLPGTKSTPEDPNLGHIWSTPEGRNRLKAIPDLIRYYQGAWYNTGRPAVQLSPVWYSVQYRPRCEWCASKSRQCVSSLISYYFESSAYNFIILTHGQSLTKSSLSVLPVDATLPQPSMPALLLVRKKVPCPCRCRHFGPSRP